MQLGIRFAKIQGDAIGGVSISTVIQDAQDHTGALVAYDPVQQKVRWKVQHSYFWNGGAVATGGGLVFQGTADGYFTAFDARSGKSVWRFNAGLGIIAAPITYLIGDVQYVSVLVGYGGTNVIGDVMNAGWKFGAQPRRLLTFQLNGKAVLPPGAPQDFHVHAVDDPSVKINEADVAAGQLLYAMNCSNCHGLNTLSAGAPAPDLRESAAALDRDTLWKIVHDGDLLQEGMPRIDGLDANQVGQIYAFIRAKAREALTPGAREK
jgi:quinohemoprotein ethanol dehydrogenase